jgi:hypothetical protein
MSSENKRLIAYINKALGSLKTPYTPNKPSPNSRFKLPVSPTLTAARRNALGITPLKLNFNNKKK